MKFEISLFRFDCQKDYLPYFTKHFLKVKEEKTLLDLFHTLKEENEFSFEDSIETSVIINSICVDMSTSLKEIKKVFGNDLEISPITTKYVYKDFLYNDDEYYKKLDILSPLVDDELKEKYESYKKYYYTSNTFNYEKDYIGDSILLLAYDIIENDNSYASIDIILEALENQEKGVEYHTSLENKIFNIDENYRKKIDYFQSKLKLARTKDEDFFKNKKAKELIFDEINANCIQKGLNDFSASFYSVNEKSDDLEFLEDLELNLLKLSSHRNDLAIRLAHKNDNLTYRICADMLLDAIDNNADFVIVDNKQIFYLLDSNQKEFTKLCGRDINIPILHINEVKYLASGDSQKAKDSLNKHHTKVPL